MSSEFFATPHDKERASEELGNLFRRNGEISDEDAEWLHDYLERRSPGLEAILASSELEDASEISDDRIIAEMVEAYDVELFEGEFGRELRQRILELLIDKKRYRDIYEIYLNSINHSEKEKADVLARYKESAEDCSRYCIEKIFEKNTKFKWASGKSFANKFVEKFRIPSVFAGIPSASAKNRKESVYPIYSLPDLKDYQKNLMHQVLQIIRNSVQQKRAILTLPTGSGKTRIAVESIVQLLNELGPENNILWIADSEEVLEQAVQSFRQAWQNFGKYDIDIFRTWENNEIPNWDEKGFIVAGIKKLFHNRSQLEERISTDERLKLIVIDETHKADTRMYREVFDSLGLSFNISNGLLTTNDRFIPVIGLTATPERTKQNETMELHNLYGDNVLLPRILEVDGIPDSDDDDIFDENWGSVEKIKKKLTEKEYLAVAEYEEIKSEKEIELNKEETEDLEEKGEKGTEWIKKLATSAEYNRLITKRILELAKDERKIIYFGTNVAQASIVSNLLKKNGIQSAMISSDTKTGVRRKMVESFNSGDGLQVLCNFNVLSTGFDSPKVDVVFISRATTSWVSFEQMKGRGLRGKKMGGNDNNRCLIVTVRYNLKNHRREIVELARPELELEIPHRGKVFTNDEIHQTYGVQKQGGIRFSNNHRFVLLIDSDESNYEDVVDEKNNSIVYTGTGEEDQKFDEGIGWSNSRVRDSSSTLLYFKKSEPNKYVFLYQVRYDSHSFENEKNRKGKMRQVIKFKLEIVSDQPA